MHARRGEGPMPLFQPRTRLAGDAKPLRPLGRSRARKGAPPSWLPGEEVREHSRTLKYTNEMRSQPLWLAGEDGRSWGRRPAMGSCGNGEVWEVWKSLGMLRNTQGRLEDALECLNYHRRFSILGVVVGSLLGSPCSICWPKQVGRMWQARCRGGGESGFYANL